MATTKDPLVTHLLAENKRLWELVTDLTNQLATQPVGLLAALNPPPPEQPNLYEPQNLYGDEHAEGKQVTVYPRHEFDTSIDPDYTFPRTESWTAQTTSSAGSVTTNSGLPPTSEP